MGAVAVPILTDFPAAQIGTIVEHAGCRVVLVSSRLRRETRLGDSGAPEAERPEVLDLEETAGGEGSFEFPPVSAGRPRGHHLHLGHHRPLEGRHADARQHRLERRGDPDHHRDAPRGPAAFHPAARSHLRVQPRPRGGPPAGCRGHVPRPAADRLGAAAGPRRGAADRHAHGAARDGEDRPQQGPARAPAACPLRAAAVAQAPEPGRRGEAETPLRRAPPLLRHRRRRPRARRRAVPRRSEIPLRHRVRPDGDLAPGRRLRAVPHPCRLDGSRPRRASRSVSRMRVPAAAGRSRCAGPT